MTNVIDFESERLKRLLERELERWCISIDVMTSEELEVAIKSLKENRID